MAAPAAASYAYFDFSYKLWGILFLYKPALACVDWQQNYLLDLAFLLRGRQIDTMGGSPILPALTVATTALVLLLVLLATPATVAKGSGLSVGFYKKLCPKAEKVVRRTVTKAFEKEPGTPADIIRLFFHDCFVRVSSPALL
jgi:hypothetical protein